jgi:hydrogenase maturation protease
MILVLGVGNILLTDEGVGVRVIEELQQNYVFPHDVELYDGGTGGLSLLAVIERAEHLIVVDSVLVGKKPGTIVKFGFEDLPADLTRKISSHEIDLIDVLKIAEILGKRPSTTFIGIQPKDISSYGTELLIGEYVPAFVKVIIEELKSLGVKNIQNSIHDSFKEK